ncbi:MAG: hypothetical protein R2767_07035 [Chitinophagales bacterium]|nr:hypothetical protein [Chitinophagales bacterium]HPG34278.1 hypothetical protein [Lentimicrobium sp.]
MYSDTSGTPAGPDEKIDYIVFVARITGGSGFNGFDNPGVGGYLVNGVDSFAISRGHAFTTAVDSYESFMHTFWHEMMHTVFRAPHTWTVNGVVGDYYYSYDGWGFMAPFPAMDCANSWERWWLNWITPQEITTNGTYTLKDYLEEGDALRIKIPEINAIETDQYLYLENHQMINYWDRKPAYTAESEALSAGVYGFIAAKGHDRSLPISTSNPYANMFKSLNAEGRFDFITIGETEVYGVGAPGDKQKIFQKTVSNPISGQGDFERIRADHDSTGIIEVADGSNRQGVGSTIDTYNDTWLFAAESDGVTSSPTYSFTGDADLAFQVGDEISLSGILPALNYPQYHGTPDGTTDYLDPYYLNGLKVKILSFNAITKEYSIEVKFDDWEVRENKRWCGNIIMPADNDLVIKDGVTVTLNKTGTPNRRTSDAIHGFYEPTKLTIEAGASLKLNAGSCLLVDDYSTLIIQNGAELLIEENAALHVKNNGKIILEDGGPYKSYSSFW